MLSKDCAPGKCFAEHLLSEERLRVTSPSRATACGTAEKQISVWPMCNAHVPTQTAAGEVTCFLAGVSCSARTCCHVMSVMFRGADGAGMLPAVQQLNLLEDWWAHEKSCRAGVL